MPKTTLKLSRLLATLPVETREAILAVHPDPESIDVRRKQYVGAEVEFEEGERASTGLITSRSVDRDGEILLPGGAQLTAYAANPVVLWGHDASQPPVGKAVSLEIDDYGIRAKTVYAETERANEVWQLVRGGFLNAHSIGFIPLEWADRGTKGWEAATKDLTPAEIDGANRVFTKYELLEYSIVSVPANPTALIEARAKGLQISDDIAKSLGVDTTQSLDSLLPDFKGLDALELPTFEPIPDLTFPQFVPVKGNLDLDHVLSEALKRIRGDFA